MIWLGVDTGGTFTDFVLWRDGCLRVHKVLSTPDAPERAILQGIREMGLAGEPLRLVHGSTVATNAALEGKGVKTLYITNRGFGDLLSIGRQNRRELYDLQPPPVTPPVPPERCLETGGRLSAGGEWLEPLTAADLRLLQEQVAALQPRAVAVNLLFSYLDGSAEQAIADALPADLFVSLSSQVLPEIREYERGMATWLNAWVGPLVEGYLRRLGEGVSGRVSVMQSSGETVAAEQAGGQAVRMLLSGPAGGLIAARFIGAQAGCERLLTFDMGGTSTDVALLDGEPRLTSEGRIGNYPVAVPMVDMHTIGAGGGSIAWLDSGGMLQVGPESAGADPGPACYGGGDLPTVTDANLVLGRLRAEAFLGGGMPLDIEAAHRALQPLAQTIGCTLEDVAQGIVDIANEHMARALRAISIQRGIDPRGYTLVSFGGAGGLHVCALAEALELQDALVPVHGGVLSALGMLTAAPGRQLSRTWLVLLAELEAVAVDAAFGELAAQGIAALGDEGVAGTDCQVTASMDLRYQGQSYTLNIPWHGDVEAAVADFHERHEARYGHRMALAVELVTLRVAVTGPRPELALATPGEGPLAEAAGWCELVGLAQAVPRYERSDLVLGQQLPGPAVISEQVATTWVASGWSAKVDSAGNLRLRRGGEA